MFTTMSDSQSFDVLDDPWLDIVRSTGAVEAISLRELLKSAHSILRLSEASPLTEAALLRFLIALVSDGLRDVLKSEADWQPFVDERRNGLWPSDVESILAPLIGRSNLLDAAHDAFFDGPSVKTFNGWDDLNARQPASRFLPELPTGTNLAHFSHLNDEAAAICIGCLLKSRLVDSAFARGGLGPSLSRSLLATISGTEPRYVMLSGATLLETLLLNVVIADRSRPAWIRIHRASDGEPGALARMSWRPRLVLPLKANCSLICVVCGTSHRPRLTQVVMVDTYNATGSKFGSKDDVERWKKPSGEKAARDSQLISFEGWPITLGLAPNEWPLRALTRMLAADADLVSRTLVSRAAAFRQVSLSVTSSDGNQAKIDDAPAASLRVPAAVLQMLPAARGEVALALRTIFDKKNNDQRPARIAHGVADLLQQLAASSNPQEVVSQWLFASNSSEMKLPEIEPHEVEPGAARKLLQRLMSLTADELATLRIDRAADEPARAARQAAFEQVWHRAGIKGDFKRPAWREALASIGNLIARHPEAHARRGRFAVLHQIQRVINHERRSTGNSERTSSTERLVNELCSASAAARDVLLERLIEQLARTSPDGRVNDGRIDFEDLLLELVDWSCPREPTPQRWRKLIAK